MRLTHPDGSTVHLAYCSNVHAAEDLDGVVAQLRCFTGPVRERLGVARLGLGLWLAAPLAARLAREPGSVALLRAALDRHGVEVVTLNGFPYRAFHAPVVKHAVYRPDWAEAERGRYTADLAAVLARLLPDDAAGGSISTLPVGWRERFAPSAEAAWAGARDALARLADDLDELERATGRNVRVGLEPEPGCAVETTGAAVAALDGLDTGRLGVCLDACHLAVQFEDPTAALAELAAAGVPVVKAQVSAALAVAAPRAAAAAALLREFAEPRFLHQTRERVGGVVRGSDDLDEALDGGLPGTSEWRVHFHVPVHDGAEGPERPDHPDRAGGGGQDALRRTLAALMADHPVTPHLEVETYTWSVLPADRRPTDDAGLVAGLAAELDWTRRRLAELGLVEQP